MWACNKEAPVSLTRIAVDSGFCIEIRNLTDCCASEVRFQDDEVFVRLRLARGCVCGSGCRCSSILIEMSINIRAQASSAKCHCDRLHVRGIRHGHIAICCGMDFHSFVLPLRGFFRSHLTHSFVLSPSSVTILITQVVVWRDLCVDKNALRSEQHACQDMMQT